MMLSLSSSLTAPARASGKNMVVGEAWAVMNTWHRDSSTGGYLLSPELERSLTQGVDKVDQSPCLVLVLEIQNGHVIDEEGAESRGEGDVVGWPKRLNDQPAGLLSC